VSKSNPTPNDDRSRKLNPNDPVGKDAIDHRSDQLNPQNDAYQGPDRAK
jgi:hypothetical protein